jgi:two-component system, OmpR family, KDP operon response regulator KdpE
MNARLSLRQRLVKHEVQVSEAPEGRISSTAVIEAGDFRIDTAERTAILRGQELPLTSEEFDVLVYLARHPQRLVTPHTVLSTSWTSEGLHQTEFLKGLLSLRKKLDALGAGKQYLRTEPWVIYRFDPNSSFLS